MFSQKQSLKSLTPYKPNIKQGQIKLDANEANYNIFTKDTSDSIDLNRYPDNYATKLREAISVDQNVMINQIMVGNGSSELLELIVKTYLNPNEIVLSISPSFVMYEKYVLYNNGIFKTLSVNDQMTINIDNLITQSRTLDAKIIFLCTPNNPTGQRIDKEDIIKLLKQTNAIVVVDEAYIEFAGEEYSMISLINEYDNLFVTRTFSKAYGLAALRVGYLITSTNNIETLSIVKTPYNVSQLSLNIATSALKQKQKMLDYIQKVNQQKKILRSALEKKNIKVFPSEGNFLLVNTTYPLATKMAEHGILIRSFNNNLYRITIPGNNDITNVLEALKEV